jgi:hypothetical protein
MADPDKKEPLYKHIAVRPETKKKFDDLCRIKGMTQDGLIRLLMERL